MTKNVVPNDFVQTKFLVVCICRRFIRNVSLLKHFQLYFVSWKKLKHQNIVHTTGVFFSSTSRDKLLSTLQALQVPFSRELPRGLCKF